MRNAILEAVLVRADHVCAWCGCDMRTPMHASDMPIVCKLDLSECDSAMVASCIACNAEFRRWWDFSKRYCPEMARRILGRHEATESGPFVDYLERVTGRIGAFTTALARIEAQRNATLGLVRKARAA